MITRKGKSAVKQVTASQLYFKVEELLEEIFQSMLDNPHCSIRAVMYIVVEKEMWGKLRKDVINEMRDAHIVSFIDIAKSIDRFLQKVFFSRIFVAPVATYVRPKTNIVIEDKTPLSRRPTGSIR